MTANERLNRVRAARTESNRLLLKVEELENLATKITPVLSLAPKGEGGSYKDDSWANLIDYKARCQSQLDEYLTACKELTEELECIKNPRIRTAMLYRYVDCYKVEDIAEHMHYDVRNVYVLLRKGKKIYCKVYEDD